MLGGEAQEGYERGSVQLPGRPQRCKRETRRSCAYRAGDVTLTLTDTLVWREQKDGNRPGSPGYDPRTVYIPKSAWQEFTPFEKQFWEIKQDHWDTVLFFQKGKFYELYEEDALIGHREFDLKLTDRVKMKMVGVPEASFDLFAAKFLALGYKVGRVDQCETAVAKGMRTGDKKPGGGSEIVRRELRHVLTSGTIVDADSLPDDLNNYCISIKVS